MSDYPTQVTKSIKYNNNGLPFTELQQKDLYVYVGLNNDLAKQLVERSREPQIIEFCPNDAKKRFADIEAVKTWQAKGRLAVCLTKMINDKLVLMGFGWVGPQQPSADEPNISGAKTTFAIRIYNGAAGQGNAQPFTKAILAVNDDLFGNDGLWLEAWGDNIAALKTYQKVGFEKVAETTGERHDKKCSRVYMLLNKKEEVILKIC